MIHGAAAARVQHPAQNIQIGKLLSQILTLLIKSTMAMKLATLLVVIVGLAALQAQAQSELSRSGSSSNINGF